MGYTTKIYKSEGGDAMTVASGGAITVEAGATVTGIARPVRTSTEATYTLTHAMSGMVYRGTRDTSTQIITLPAATTPGLEFTFICGHASGEININPGTATMTGVAFDGNALTVATNKDLKNTAATNVVGDVVTVVSDGTGWLITSIHGVWAST